MGLFPVLAVLLFAMAVVAAISYLRMEEMQAEQQSVQRDGEHSRQRVNLRLAERQEQLQKFGRELQPELASPAAFADRVSLLSLDNPEVLDVTWLNLDGKARASKEMHDTAGYPLPRPGMGLPLPQEQVLLDEVRKSRQARYVVVTRHEGEDAFLAFMLPLGQRDAPDSFLYARYNLSSLLYYAIPSDVFASYAVSLMDAHKRVVAGQSVNPDDEKIAWWQLWSSMHSSVYNAPLATVDNVLTLHLRAYRASGSMTNRGLFLLVLALSALTAWMLIANWLHLRRRQRSQQELLSETSFRRAMENSLVIGMRALDLDGRISYVNSAFCQMTGWSAEELIGQRPPYSFWHEDDHTRHHRILSKTLQDQIPQGGYVMRVLRKNGTTFEARIYMSPLIGVDGRQTGWMSSMTDITEPNRIKRQLTNAYERFTRVLDALDVSISVAPLGSKELLFANQAYRHWFTDDNAAGHMQMLTKAGSPGAPVDGVARNGEDTLAGLPTTALQDASNNTEIYLAGLGKWIEVRSRYLEWVDGRLAQLVVATDITARRQAEEQSAQHEARAQAASRLVTMGEMASSVAHELNQPLTAINNYCNGMISRLRNGQIDQEALLGALDKTSRQAQRAGQIIQRIRTFVKRSTPNYSDADVETMVVEAVELAEIEMRRRNVRLQYRVERGLPILRVDKILVEQVLINLLKNAAEAIDLAGMLAERRHVRLDVSTAVREDRPVIEFSIEDQGSGLSQETLDHLFEAFYTTKAEGMGIGLNLCRSIVESHQGRLMAENIYNDNMVTGCRFTFWLPIPTTPVSRDSQTITS